MTKTICYLFGAVEVALAKNPFAGSSSLFIVFRIFNIFSSFFGCHFPLQQNKDRQ